MNAILEHLNAGTLVRGTWGDGRETACLYSAMFPGAAAERREAWDAIFDRLLGLIEGEADASKTAD